MWAGMGMAVVVSGFCQLSVAAADGGRGRDGAGNRVHSGKHENNDHDDGHCELKHGKERIQPLYGLATMSTSPFPSDRFTIADDTQNTCKRVNLPVDCTVTSTTQPNDCVEIGLLNQLDGFNIRPRIAIPFSGAIDLTTANSATIFLVSLGSPMVAGVPDCLLPPVGDEDGDHDGEHEHDDHDFLPPADAGWVVGIDQGIWDPDTNTLYVEAAEPLEQHTRYALFVTSGVKDMNGKSIEKSKDFKRVLENDEEGEHEDDDHVPLVDPDPSLTAYKKAVRLAVNEAHFFGIKKKDIAAASVFSTMSVTSVMEKVHNQIASIVPSKADFKIGPAGARAVFNLSTITAMTFNRQIAVSGALSPTSITPRLAFLRLVPGAIAQMSSAKFKSPRYLQNRVMPAIGTFSGTPVVQAYDDLFFTLYTPSGTKPAGGWPVVIFGHGTNDTVYGGPLNVASEFASKGFATISFNYVGSGFGPNSSLTVTRTAANGGAMTFPSGSRGFDVDGNGSIDVAEGNQQGPPIGILLASNSIKQSIIDTLQLVQVIKAGVDIDGDGQNDLNGGRQYFSGFSLGSFVGVPAFVLEPALRAASFTGVGGWPVLWFLPSSRGIFGEYLQNHLPNLMNPAGTPGLTSIGGLPVSPPFFNENQPDSGQAPIVNNVPGAIAIQGAWEKFEWLSNTAMPGAHATHLRMNLLPGSSARPFLIHIARGDQSAPNFQTADFIDAGMLADRATLYRHDLFAQKLSIKNPHRFLIGTDNTFLTPLAIQSQLQVGTFFQTDGATTIDPDGAGVLFETPASFIPRDTAYIP